MHSNYNLILNFKKIQWKINYEKITMEKENIKLNNISNNNNILQILDNHNKENIHKKNHILLNLK